MNIFLKIKTENRNKIFYIINKFSHSFLISSKHIKFIYIWGYYFVFKGGTISDFSDKIDEYRKLAVKILFRILIVKNIALAIFMALIDLFSMLSCID